MSERDDSGFACPEMRGLGHDGHCARCDNVLTGRQKRWCSSDCVKWYLRNHTWTDARSAALSRDDHRCVRCGDGWHRSGSVRLEVNHIVPRVGRGYGRGCHHHQDNLETLCHNHHVEVTNAQRLARMEAHPQLDLGAAS